jgi:uncharacterized membrane protein
VADDARKQFDPPKKELTGPPSDAVAQAREALPSPRSSENPMLKLALAFTTILTVGAVSPASAQTWTVTLLTATGGGGATDVNNLGAIVGGAQAALWPTATSAPVALPGPTGATTWSPTAINDSGLIVGNGNNWFFPTLWTAGVPSVLPYPPGGTQGALRDINAAGEIAGYAENGGYGYYATRWTTTGPTMLPRPANASTCSGEAINDAGDMVGYCNLPNGARATLWIGQTPIVLGLLASATATNANDLDDSGRIVGYSMISGKFTATLWTDGVPKKLAKLTNADGSIASGINTSGRMVGWTSLKNGTLVATTWLGLSSALALPTAPGTNHCSAESINDSGRIVGHCYSTAVIPYVYRPVIWTPNP